MSRRLDRREFLRLSALAAAGVTAAACQPKTVIVKETVEVEKEVTKVVKETVEVEKEITKIVEMQVEVEKVITATPSVVREAPMLYVQVAEGELPPLEERLTADPNILEPVEEIGEYGGTWRRVAVGIGGYGLTRSNMACPFFWDRTGESIIPDLFKSLEIGEGGKTYTFGMRRGHRWSDGEPFTANDITYLYEDVWLNGDLSPAGPSGWLKVGGEPVVVEKVDDYTVRYVFPAPYGLFMLNVAYNGEGMWDGPAHYMKQFHADYVKKEDLDKMMAEAEFDTWDKLYWDKNGYSTQGERPTLRPWAANDPPGPGDTTGTMARNAYYHKIDPEGNQLPYIDKVRFTLVENAEMVRLKAIAGEIDMQLRNIDLASYPLLAEGAAKGDYHLILWEELGTGMVVFPNHTLLKDDEVRALNNDIRWRKAISHLIDRDEVNELVYLGLAGPIQGCFPASLASEKELWEPFEYDPDRANELLDELGLDKRDASGNRLLPSGKPLAITIEGFEQWTDVMDGSELVVAKMQEAGINAALKGIPYANWWDRIYTSEYQITTYYKDNSGPLLQAIYERAYTPTQRSTYWAPEWGLWYSTNGEAGEEPTGEPRELQKLYDQIKDTADEATRVELFTQLYHDYLVFFPDIITCGRKVDPGVVKNNFHNVPDQSRQSWPLKTPALTNPEQYFFRD